MAPLADRMEGIEEYFKLVKTNIETSVIQSMLDKPVQAVIEEFAPIRGTRLRSRRNVILNMKLSTNSGSPYFKRRKRVVEKTLAGQTRG